MATTILSGSPANGVNAWLKNVYFDAQKAVNEQSVFLTNIGKNMKVKNMGGKVGTWPVAIAGPSGATAAFVEGGGLPAGYNPLVETAVASYCRTATGIAVSREDIKRGTTSATGYQPLREMIDMMLARRGSRLNTHCYGFPVRTVVTGSPTDPSLNGIAGRITGISGTTGTITRPLGYTLAQTGGQTKCTKNLRINDVLAYGTSLTGTAFTVKGRILITAIDSDASTITYTVLDSTGGAIANNDWLSQCAYDDSSKNDFNKVYSGLGILVDQAADSGGQAQTFEGIAVSPNNYRAWGTYKRTNAGVFVTSDWTDTMRTVQGTAGVKPNMLVMDPTMRDIYAESLLGDVRFEAQNVAGGWTGVKWAYDDQVMLVTDNDCPYGITFALNTKKMGWMVLEEGHFVSEGNNYLQRIPFTDSYELQFTEYKNLTFDLLNAHAVIVGCPTPNATI